jgi:hypothetical protein
MGQEPRRSNQQGERGKLTGYANSHAKEQKLVRTIRQKPLSFDYDFVQEDSFKFEEPDA